MLLGCMLGPYPIPAGDVRALARRRARPIPRKSILSCSRSAWPRAAGSVLVGPLLRPAPATRPCSAIRWSCPDILGVSAGAGFGAVLGILLSLPVAGHPGAGLRRRVSTVAIVYAWHAALRSQNEILVLVLAGIVVGALAGAGISLVKILADPYNHFPPSPSGCWAACPASR